MPGPPPPPPGPPPPPTITSSQPPPSTKGRGDLLADIRKGNATKLKKVPASQKKDASVVDVKQAMGGSSGAKSSVSSSSSSASSGSSGGGPQPFISSGNPMMDEIMRKRANLGNKSAEPRSTTPPKTATPPQPSTQTKAFELPKRTPPPSVPQRQTVEPPKQSEEPPKRAPPPTPQRQQESPQVPQRKAPPPVPTRREPPPPITEKRAPPQVPSTSTRDAPPIPVKRAPPPTPQRQDTIEPPKKEAPSIPVRQAPPQQTAPQQDTQSNSIETDGRFQFRTDLPPPPPFKGLPKTYKSGKSQGTELNISSNTSTPTVQHTTTTTTEVRSAPPVIPVRKAPPPTVPSRVTTDYTQDADETVQKLKNKMDEHARNYEFEKCAPLRDLMRQIEEQKQADSTSAALKQLVDKAQTLL